MPASPFSPDASTRLVALLGFPVEHSLSPRLHNAAFRAQGLNWAYVAAPVHPGDEAAAVNGLKALGFAGANVTIPHKETAFALADTRSPGAEAVGAANTLVCRRTDAGVTVHADNTDVAGFLEGLAPHADRLQGASMVVFGAGGAARAVVYALLSAFAPAELTLAVRRPAQAAAVAAALAAYDPRGALRVVSLDAAAPAVRAATLLVNATPLGMHPHLDGTPWPAAGDFEAGQIVYDLVYNPAETRLLRDAAARGATAVGGLAMLIGQAAAAYHQWTGHVMPRAAVHAALQHDGGS